jgi:hypothetical protein|tara:strand:- start:2398 stop:2832 length:435 start_codon:yes stop_codon:yes gene_type:complete
MSRSGALDRIDALLSEITDPPFVGVIRAEPLALAGTPVVCFWISGRQDRYETLGDIGSTTTVLIRAYWRLQSSRVIQEAVELDIWDAAVNIDSQLRSDANLAGNVTDSRVGAGSVQIMQVGDAFYRTLTVPYEMDIYGEVTITP